MINLLQHMADMLGRSRDSFLDVPGTRSCRLCNWPALPQSQRIGVEVLLNVVAARSSCMLRWLVQAMHSVVSSVYQTRYQSAHLPYTFRGTRQSIVQHDRNFRIAALFCTSTGQGPHPIAPFCQPTINLPQQLVCKGCRHWGQAQAHQETTNHMVHHRYLCSC